MLNSLPFEKILLESDSPSMFSKNIYLSENEYSFYFKDEKNEIKNHPLSIVNLAKKLSNLRKIPFNDFLRQIIKNNIHFLKKLI
jgi:Tat protein secretion system quality control protein TatD with DNase activity